MLGFSHRYLLVAFFFGWISKKIRNLSILLQWQVLKIEF